MQTFKFNYQPLFWEHKNRKIQKKTYQKNEEISRWKAHINTWKLHWYALTTTDVSLNQKRVNVWCEHMVKTTTYPLLQYFPFLILRTFPYIQNVFLQIFEISCWNFYFTFSIMVLTEHRTEKYILKKFSFRICDINAGNKLDIFCTTIIETWIKH